MKNFKFVFSFLTFSLLLVSSVFAKTDTAWVRRYNNSTVNDTDYVRAMTVDNSGNVYVTGTSYSSSNSFDYLTLKYNSAVQKKLIINY